MMPRCAAPGCNSHATKGSAFCLSHAIETGGGFFLATMTGVWVDPVTPPAPLHQTIRDAIKEGEKTK